jgi:hypothetical protein
MEMRRVDLLWRCCGPTRRTCSHRQFFDFHSSSGKGDGSRAAGRGKQIADALDRLPRLLRSYCGPGELLYDDDIRASDICHREQHPVHFLWLAGTHLSGLRSAHSLAANQSD